METNNEREILEKELIAYRESACMVPLHGIELSWIITFILADRARIVADQYQLSEEELAKIIYTTLFVNCLSSKECAKAIIQNQSKIFVRKTK